MDLRPYFPNIWKTQWKTSVTGEKGGTGDHTGLSSSHVRSPQAESLRSLMTLPVVTALSGEARGWLLAQSCTERLRSRAEVALRSDWTGRPVSPLLAQTPSCVSELTGDPPAPLQASAPWSPALTAGRVTAVGSWDTRFSTLTISRFLGSPRVVPTAPAAGLPLAASETPGSLTAGETRNPEKDLEDPRVFLSAAPPSCPADPTPTLRCPE